MLALERRKLILQKIQDEKRVMVSELSRIFNVSEETIRRDLDKMDKDGIVLKSYGGAILNQVNNIDMPFNMRKKINVDGKQKIAEIISRMVDDGDHIMLDASTTGVFIAKALKSRSDLTVVTNSVEILIELSDVEGWNMISTGGSVKKGVLALVGYLACESIRKYSVEKAIISCKALHLDKGLMDSNEGISQMKREMIRSTQKCILAADKTKFGNVAFCKIEDLEEIDIVVTDEKPDDEWLLKFETLGIECIWM